MVNHVVPPPQSMFEIAWGFVPRQSNLGRDQAIAWLAAPVRALSGQCGGTRMVVLARAYEPQIQSQAA